MKKILRYLLGGIAVVILLLVAAVVIFAATFDANAYKQDLAELALEHSGRELKFDGDVELTFYPALGMRLGGMSFANAEGFGEQPMLRVGEAAISVDLLSLLAFAPEIDRLVLRDVEVNLMRNAAGVSNWDDLLPRDEGAAGSGSAADAGADPAAGGGFAIRGAFGGLDLQDISVNWIDAQAGSELRITNLDISTGRIAPNEAFPLNLQVQVSGDAEVDVSLDTRVEYLLEQQQLTLADIELALNEFVVTGRLQLSDFARPTPKLRFELASQELDVDALLGIAPARAAGPEPATTAETGAESETGDTRIALPMQLLRDLDIKGRLELARVKAQNLQMSDVDMALEASGGLLSLKPVTLKLYDGEARASVVVDVRGAAPKYGVDKTLAGIQIGSLLRDFTGEETLSGTLEARANLSTGGEWLSALKRNSNGTLELAFKDGAVSGFNIRHSIDAARAKLRGEEPPPRETLKTDFSALSIGGVIRNGVFSSDDLSLVAPLLRVSGQGSADLVAETVDYLVNAKLVGTVEGQQGKAADELKGVEIPVGIEGPWRSVKIDVLLDEMMKARVAEEKAKLKAEIEAQKKALKEQIEAEKKALEEARRREAEKKLEVEKKKLEAELKKKKEELLQKLID